MISKKNKSLVAGILAAATTATAVIPALSSAAAVDNEYATENGANKSYATMFSSLYDDVITNGEANGYLSSNKNGDSFGIPYHSRETLCIEAPDYGHETTSEAMSYIVWMAAMHDALVHAKRIEGSSHIAKAWKTLEAIIPGRSIASGRTTDIKYETFWTQNELKSDVAPELDFPELYPTQNTGARLLTPCSASSRQLTQAIRATTSCTGSLTLMTGMASQKHLERMPAASHSSIHSSVVSRSLVLRLFLILVAKSSRLVTPQTA